MSATVKRYKNGELIEEKTYSKSELSKLKNKGKSHEDKPKSKKDKALQEEVSETKEEA